MGSTRLSVDVPRLVGLYEQGRLQLYELMSQRYPLERINDAIEAMETGQSLRNVVVIDEEWSPRRSLPGRTFTRDGAETGLSNQEEVNSLDCQKY